MWTLPNLITLGRLGFLPLILWMIWPGVETRETCFWAGLLYGFAGALDILDGAIARRTNQVTVLGKFLDPLVDKLYLIITLVALMQLPGERVPAWLVMIVIVREIAITGLRAMAAADGIVIAAGEGGKLKTVFGTLGTCALIIHYPYYINFGFMRSVLSPHYVGLLITYASVLISLWSAWGYTHGFIKVVGARSRV